ncbi:MAG: cupin domain-containing protein [Magnetospirillum sp.]
MTKKPAAIVAAEAPPRTKPSIYPAPFAASVAGRVKRPLGDLFGLTNFGINLTRLPPGSASALRHAHSVQDEFIYVLEGTATLRDDAGDTLVSAGMCAGFKAGGGAHQLLNLGDQDLVYLEIGDRAPGDSVDYPDDDLTARNIDGAWRFFHKDGTPYED